MRFVVTLVLNITAYSTFAQAGASFVALGKNLANDVAQFALANNPATASKTKANIGTWGTNRFTGTRLVNGGVAANFLLKNTGVGMQFYYRGNAYFNFNTLEMGLSQKISPAFSVGFAIGRTTVFQGADYGNKHFVTGKIGASAQINSFIDIAFVLVNPWLTQNTLTGISPQIHISAGYKVNKQTKLWAQFRNENGHPAICGLALQHNTSQNLTLQASMQTGYEPISAGLVLKRKQLSVGFSSGYHIYLGFSPSFSLLWSLQ